MPVNQDDRTPRTTNAPQIANDEGGLRAPPGLSDWAKAWWWFDFIVLVNLARLRFVAILVVIGLVIMKWSYLTAVYDKWTRPANEAAAKETDIEYFCPMHPTVIRDHPDKCPICGMPLSKRKKADAHAAPLPAGAVSRVQLTPYRIVLAGVQTWPVDYVPLTKQVSAVGFVEFDERGQRTVAARVAGRIDKLVANETGQMVMAGDELAVLYSPELSVTVQNLLDAKRSGNQAYLENARTRLQLQGIDDAQIAEILAADKPTTQLRIRSPISGHVITKYVREGQYVEEGKPLYELADLSTVWIQAQIYEEDLAFLPAEASAKPGAVAAHDLVVTATTRAFPGEPFEGKLAFVYPHADQDTRTVTIRIELANPDHKLKPGSTATITLKVQPKDIAALAVAASESPEKELLAEGKALAVPEGAVIDTGKQQIVYREASPGVFEGMTVVLGPTMSGPDGAIYYPVLRGLHHGDRVVTTGSFLVDAETRLNPAAGSLYMSGSGSKEGKPGSAMVRPSTPEDPDVQVNAGLAALSAEDRALAERQKFCAVLNDSRLGVMGAPIKLMIEGEPVFLCCNSCKEKALAEPAAALAAARRLRAENAADSK